MTHRVSIIALGVMGQRMLTHMTAHEQCTAVAAWDPNAAACARTGEQFPSVRIAASTSDALRVQVLIEALRAT